MWVVLAGILMVYFFGFLVYICYNTSRKRNLSSNVDVENPSSGSTLSALQADGTVVTTTLPRSGSVGNCCALSGESHNWRPNNRTSSIHTGLNFGLPSCLYYDEITQRNSDLPQSALAAHRQQQLRQIKLEINELSRRLGIGQLYRERQLYLRSESNRRRGGSNNDYNYSPIPQRELSLSTPHDSCVSLSGNRTSIPAIRGPNLMDGDRMVMVVDDNPNDDEEGSLSSSDDSSLDTTLSNSLPLVPNTTNSCSSSISNSEPLISSSSPATALGLGLVQTFTLGDRRRSSSSRNEIFHQRQRRLRLIRMEIEDLTLQLTSLSEDRSISEHNAGGCSISSDLEGFFFDQDADENEGRPRLNMNSSSFQYLGELPSYDESIIVHFDDSPPPSYAQCTNTLSNTITSTTFISNNVQGAAEQELARMVAYYSPRVVYEEKDVNQSQGSR